MAPGVGFEDSSVPSRPQRTYGVWVRIYHPNNEKTGTKSTRFFMAPGVGFEPTTN